MKIIYMGLEHDSLEAVIDILSRLGLTISDTISIDGIPEKYLDRVRMQYRGDEVNKWLYSRWGGEMILGIFSVDAYVPALNFIFGVASPLYNTATVYTARLSLNADKKVFHERLRKEVLHEILHLYGLGHCSNYRCVMSFSNSIHDVDRKTYLICRRDFNKLIERGLKPDESILLK